MPNDSQLQKAYRQGVLWPPIHAGIDVFLRRRAAGAEPYELTWRLIHIWECITITLAGAAVSRFLSDTTTDEVDRRLLREKLFGLSWDPTEQTLETVVGALPDGSIDKWIEILQFVVSVNPQQGAFLPSLVQLLSGRSVDSDASPAPNLIDLSPLVAAWSRACEVSQNVRAESVPALSALRAVNSFRNRLAHVPFPYDAMRDIASGLVACTEQLFSLAPSPTSGSGPLAGAIVHKSTIIQGAATNETQRFQEAGPSFVFGAKRASTGEIWTAVPFIHIDGMFRPYVLTRIKRESAEWEYTRYLAEANAVLLHLDRSLFSTLPLPCREEYEEHGVVEDTENSIEIVDRQSLVAHDMGDATYFIRNRKFAPAIAYLENRTREQPQYHVGWLHLGRAQRELAADQLNRSEPDLESIRKLLDASLYALNQAKGHPSRDYKSEAEYHMSKALFRRWQLDCNSIDLVNAVAHADEAVSINPLQRYLTWTEYLTGLSSNEHSADAGEPSA